jgi:prepilin peptidase CpaA
LIAVQSAWAYFVLVAASAVLLVAAWTDLREYKIRNDLVLALAAMFVLYAVLFRSWSDLKWDLAFAALMFVVMLVAYVSGWMGGGDVKLLGVAFLWSGFSGALPFAILLSLFSAAHVVFTKLGWAHSQQTDTGRHRIPFAPSVAGALIGVFLLRAVHLV